MARPRLAPTRPWLLDRLEDRTTPALQLGLAGGALTLQENGLSSDAVTITTPAPNTLQIDLGGAPFDIASTSGASITYDSGAPESSTTVLIDTTSVQTVTINLGGDADQLQIDLTSNLTLTGAKTVTLDTGLGNDVLRLFNLTTNVSNYTITTNDGADVLRIDGALPAIAGTISLGTGNDTFIAADQTALAGVDGGTGNDAYDLSLWTTAVAVNLPTATTTVGTFTSFEQFVGGNSKSSLTLNAGANAVAINGIDAGTINGAVKFSQFGFLTGNANNDTFTVGPGASLSGQLDGAGGTNTLDFNTLNYSQAVNVTLTAPNAGTATAIGSFANLAGVTGDQDFAASNLLTGTVTGQTYAVPVSNIGTVGTFDFFNFGSLNGGAGDDTFVFSKGATLAGNLSGGAGVNRLDFSAYTSALTVNFGTGTATPIGGTFNSISDLITGSGDDMVTLGTPSSDVTVDGGAGNNILDYLGTGGALSPTSATSGTITDAGFTITYTNFASVSVPTPTINGTASSDRIYALFTTPTQLTVYVNNDAPQVIDLTVNPNLILNGLAGIDAFVIDASIVVPTISVGITIDGGGDIGDRVVIGGDGKSTAVFRPNSTKANLGAFFTNLTSIGIQNVGAFQLDLHDWGALNVETTAKDANLTVTAGATFDSVTPPPAITGQPGAGPDTSLDTTAAVRITGTQGISGLPVAVVVYRTDELTLDTGRVKTTSVDQVTLTGNLFGLVGAFTVFTGIEPGDVVNIPADLAVPSKFIVASSTTNIAASTITAFSIELTTTTNLNNSLTLAAPVAFNGGVNGNGKDLTVTGPITIGTDLNLTVSLLDAQDFITGGFALTIDGAAQFASSVTVNTLTVNGPLTLTGTSIITVGTDITLSNSVTGAFDLTLNAPGVTQLGGAVDVKALTTDAAGTTVLVGPVTATGNVHFSDPVTLSNDLTLTVAGTARFAAAVSGTSALVSNGTGIVRFDGLTTYTGTTTINAGTLEVNGDISASSGLIVANGAKLAGGQPGFGQLPVNLTLAAGSTLAPGDSTGPGQLTTATPTADLGSVFLVSFKAVTFPGNNVSQLNLTAAGGTLDLTGTALDAVFFSDFVPIEGEVYPIITRAAGAPPIVGTFTNTPGNSITLGGVRFTVNYAAANNGVTLTVIDAAPLIVSTTPPAAVLGQAYSFTIVATGVPAPTVAITGLPPGLSFDSATRIISGTPTQVGSFTLTITADNGNGMPAIQSTPLVVNGAANTPPIANPDIFTAVAGVTLAIPAPGVLGNDTDAEGAALSARLVSAPSTGTLVLNADGSFAYTAPAGFTGVVTFTYAADDGNIESAPTTVTLNVSATGPVGPASDGLLVVTGRGTSALLYTFSPNGKAALTASFIPFPNAGGFVRAATGDFNGDGVADVVYVTGPGGGALLRIINGTTNKDLLSAGTVDMFPGQNLTNIGLFVAAGDIDGDGIDEIAISPDQGGGPLARIFSVSANALTQRKNFLAIQDPNFRGGARVALGDLNGDGKADLIVGAGFQGGPRIALYDGADLLTGPDSLPPDQTPRKFMGDFFVFEPDPATGLPLLNGVFVTAGDLNGDGKAELIFGAGPGGGPRVQVIEFAKLQANLEAAKANSFSNFFAFDSSQRGGVRPTVKDIDNDGKGDLITGNGENSAALIKSFRGSSFAGDGSPGAELQTVDTFGTSLAAGVYVG